MFRTKIAVAVIAFIPALVCASSQVFAARPFNAKTVTVVHSGEGAGGGNPGAQCFFKVAGDVSWRRVDQGPAAATTCSIIMTAHLSGKKISYDLVSGRVKYLCIADAGC